MCSLVVGFPRLVNFVYTFFFTFTCKYNSAKLLRTLQKKTSYSLPSYVLENLYLYPFTKLCDKMPVFSEPYIIEEIIKFIDAHCKIHLRNNRPDIVAIKTKIFEHDPYFFLAVLSGRR